MKCPVCIEPTLAMSERQGVEIDYCPQCRGIWLDRGELDKLLERAAAEAPASPTPAPPPMTAAPAPSQPAPRYDERDDPRYATKRKKRSFLDDILDF
jgi:hypothetical protein